MGRDIHIFVKSINSEYLCCWKCVCVFMITEWRSHITSNDRYEFLINIVEQQSAHYSLQIQFHFIFWYINRQIVIDMELYNVLCSCFYINRAYRVQDSHCINMGISKFTVCTNLYIAASVDCNSRPPATCPDTDNLLVNSSHSLPIVYTNEKSKTKTLILHYIYVYISCVCVCVGTFTVSQNVILYIFILEPNVLQMYNYHSLLIPGH